MSTIFLLSPANVSGLRAKQLTSPRAQFDAALMYRSETGVPLGLAFAFMSALYFRGKVTYALHFGGVANTRVIAPGFGLVPPDWALNEERMKTLRKTPVDLAVRGYRKPLERDAQALASELPDDARVVLLGSVATGKYVDALLPIFGRRLHFPVAFAGLGDMARGGLLLHATRANKELEYVPLIDAVRHRPPGATGKMSAL